MSAPPSHATLAEFRVDLEREEQQAEGLSQMIVPMVRAAPGVVSGTWTLNRSASTAYVMITYTSREAAESMATRVRENADDQLAVGLDLHAIQILEIQASV